MEGVLRRNGQAVAFVIGLGFLLVGGWLLFWQRDRDAIGLVALSFVVVFLILGLVGPRLKSAKAGPSGIGIELFESFKTEVTETAKKAVTEAVSHDGRVQLSGDLKLLLRHAEEQLHMSDVATAVVYRPANPTPDAAQGEGETVVTPPLAQSVRQVTDAFAASAVISAETAMDSASTPEELAEAVVDYVRTADSIDRLAVIAHMAKLSPEDRAQLMADAETVAKGLSKGGR